MAAMISRPRLEGCGDDDPELRPGPSNRALVSGEDGFPPRAQSLSVC